MDYSITKIIFAATSFTIIIGGSLVNWFENYIPGIIIKLFKYGKFEYSERVLGSIEVPKRWLYFYYIFYSD